MNAPSVNSTDTTYSAAAASMRHHNSLASSASLHGSACSGERSARHSSSDLPLIQTAPGIPLAASSPLSNMTKSENLSPPNSPAPGTQTNRHRRNKKDNLVVALLNCRSIKNKVAELEVFLSTTDPDIVLGTESWLTPDIKNSEIFPNSYTVYRKDRSSAVKKKGGGVFILAKKKFITSLVDLRTECELIFIELKLHDQQNMKIGCMYRPQWTNDDLMDDLVASVKTVEKGKGNMWLGGDFNLPLTDWENETPLTGNTNPRHTRSLIQLANDVAMSQMVDIATRKESTLDLFFSTNPSLVNRVTPAPPLSSKADHDIILLDINTRAEIPKQKQTHRYIYTKADWNSMRAQLRNFTLTPGTVQEKWNHFETTIVGLMNDFIPKKLSKPNKAKPWISREIKTLIHQLNRAYRKWRRDRRQDSHARFKEVRTRCRREIRRAQAEYTESIFSDEGSKSKFWSFIKQKRKDSCSVAPLRKEGVLISDAVGKANILNEQYCSVFNPDNRGSEPAKDTSQTSDMPDIQVTQEGVEKMLRGLKINKAAGPDQISPCVLKNLADALSKPLTELFQSALDCGEVPHQWRSALVTPIFKKGDKSKAANYRPVSLTSVCCKLCEHLVAKAILNHMDEKELLSDLQHGFRRKRSCESQLTIFVDELTRHIKDGQQVDAVVMDFSKAFDVVPHGSLLVKLEYYGIRGNTLQWIDSFLRSRTQRVVVDAEMSDVAPVTSGVPQGSVLGPILFLVYINDMPESITSTSRLFADDTIVYRKVESEDDHQLLQNDLKALEEWESKWGMSFNPSKCSVVHMSKKKSPLNFTYTLKNETLVTSSSASYLGISISRDLSWTDHISKVVAKANKSLGFLRRNVKTKAETVKAKAYNTIVRPSLEYAASVWCPWQKGLRDNLEAVQRRAARYVKGNFERTASVSDMLSSMGWETLEERRIKTRITLLFKIAHDLIAVPATQLRPSNSRTRGHQMRYRPITARTKYYSASFFPATINYWNKLPEDLIRHKDIDAFREALSKFKLPKDFLNMQD